ncbi:MAG: serpin family protein [Eubacteriales bacterium]
MKKMILVVLCIFLFNLVVGGCSPNTMEIDNSFNMEMINNSLEKSNTSFAFDLFKQLNQEDNEENIFISPLSVSVALTMTAQGAKGTTYQEMMKALHYDGIEMDTLNESLKNLLDYLNQDDEGVEVSINNSIWIKKGEDIKKTFIANNEDIFNAKVSTLDFSEKDAADTINHWINDSTKGKIEKMIDSPISNDIVMFLINAIYFKGDWAEEFNENETYEGKFYKEGGETEDILMMSKTGDIEYGEGENYKTVKLPYNNGSISMYLVQPKEGSIYSFVSDLNVEKWIEIKNNISERSNVHVEIPRFKVEYGIKNLNNVLYKLGIKDAFDGEQANFSDITDESLSISKVLHKAVIEVDEKGSEAAGATVVILERAASIEKLNFIGDRPFLFIIADDETGSILFMGEKRY